LIRTNNLAADACLLAETGRGKQKRYFTK